MHIPINMDLSDEQMAKAFWNGDCVDMRNSDSYWTNIESRRGHDFVYYASENIREKRIPFPLGYWNMYLLKKWTDDCANLEEFENKSWEIREIRDTDLFNVQLVYKGQTFGFVSYASGFSWSSSMILDEKAMIDTGLVRLTNEDKAKERIVRAFDDDLFDYQEELTLRRERKKKFAEVLDELSYIPPNPNTGFPGGDAYRLVENDFNLRQKGLLVDFPSHDVPSDVPSASARAIGRHVIDEDDLNFDPDDSEEVRTIAFRIICTEELEALLDEMELFVAKCGWFVCPCYHACKY
jgi:hypothetical protein